MGTLGNDLRQLGARLWAQVWAHLLVALDLRHPTADTYALAAALVLIVLLLAALARVLHAYLVLRRAARPGKRLSTVARGELPLTSVRRDGSAGDPLNVRVVATAGQLGSAFAAAGWYRADEITLVTSVRISFDAVLARKYSSAPLSDLYLYGRKQDYAFEHPGPNVRVRDHVRFWESGPRAADGRPLWVGAATRDIAVVISPKTHLPTHKISGDVDEERDTLVEALEETGWVVEDEWAPGFGVPTVRDNGYGDTYETDGRVAILVLADMPVLAPITTNVRGPAIGLARAAARGLRFRLPKAGKERAARLRQRAARRASAHAAPPPQDE